MAARPTTVTDKEVNNNGDGDVFRWEGNLNAILGQSHAPQSISHALESSSSPFSQLNSTQPSSSSSSSSSSFLDHPSSIVVPERVRAYVLIAQRGLGRCLQVLHTLPSKPQGLGLGPKPELETKQWQPIVIVEAL